MNKIELHCPYCHNLLTQGENRMFETLEEHVCNPNMENHPKRPSFICINEDCPCSKEDLFWDEYGDMYGWNRNFKFKNDIDSAFPSFARQLDIEIYKKGLKSKLRLHPCLTLWFLQPMIEFTYKADEYGNVLSKGYKLIWLKKDSFNPFKKDKSGYHIHYSFPIMNIYHSIKSTYSTINKCSEGFILSQLKTELEPLADWDKRWWRKVDKFLHKVLFQKYYESIKIKHEQN